MRSNASQTALISIIFVFCCNQNLANRLCGCDVMSACVCSCVCDFAVILCTVRKYRNHFGKYVECMRASEIKANLNVFSIDPHFGRDMYKYLLVCDCTCVLKACTNLNLQIIIIHCTEYMDIVCVCVCEYNRVSDVSFVCFNWWMCVRVRKA